MQAFLASLKFLKNFKWIYLKLDSLTFQINSTHIKKIFFNIKFGKFLQFFLPKLSILFSKNFRIFSKLKKNSNELITILNLHAHTASLNLHFTHTYKCVTWSHSEFIHLLMCFNHPHLHFTKPPPIERTRSYLFYFRICASLFTFYSTSF